jgi:hypothetical protein
MTVSKTIAKAACLMGAASMLSGCIEGVGPSSASGANRVLAIGEDRGTDAGSLSQLEAGIYIDPDGCHIWMIDDGLEGYWSRRRDPVSGLPVCTDVAPPNSVVGDISRNPGIPDWVPVGR